MRRLRFRYLVGGGLAAAALCTTGLASIAAAPAGAALAPIRIGFLGDITGANASVYGDSGQAAQARVDVQNAEGGVNGHKLQLVVESTDSTVPGAQTAANVLISEGVFGIGMTTSFSELADTAIQHAGLPETGSSLDTRYDAPPFRNWFEASTPQFIGTKTVVSQTPWIAFLKAHGVTKVASVVWGGIPLVDDGTVALVKIMPKLGVKSCLLDDTVPIGTVDFTSVVLEMQQDACNGTYGDWSDASALGMDQSLKNAGVASKIISIQPAGFDAHTLQDPAARASALGEYFVGILNYLKPNAGVKAMIKAFHKYIPGYASGAIPDPGAETGWLALDEMIFGLEHAGAHPTHTSFIHYLRNNTVNYNGGGILPTMTNWTDFGTAKGVPTQNCEYMVQLRSKGWVPAAQPGNPDGEYCAPVFIVS